MGMVGGGFLSGFFQSHFPIVILAGLKDFLGTIPLTFRFLAEIPGMTLAAGKITSRLIDGKIILRTGEMNGRYKPLPFRISFSQGDPAG